MTNEQVSELVEKYFLKEWGHPYSKSDATLFNQFECRLDKDSSAIMYSMIRHFKPTSVLEVGSWLGGSTSVIMSALIKNNKPYTFVCSELEDPLRQATEHNVTTLTNKAPIMVGDVTKNIEKIPEKLDFIFIDTNHDRETNEWIVENVWPRVKKGGIFSMHDWAVWEQDGKLLGKGKDGNAALPEAEHIMGLIEQDKFPFEKIYWTYNNPAWDGMPSQWETAFWKKI